MKKCAENPSNCYGKIGFYSQLYRHRMQPIQSPKKLFQYSIEIRTFFLYLRSDK